MQQRPVYLLALGFLATSALAGAAANMCAAKSAAARATTSSGQEHRVALRNESECYAYKYDQIAETASIVVGDDQRWLIEVQITYRDVA